MTPIIQIARAAADEFGVTVEDLRSPCKRKTFCAPRHVAMALAWEAGHTVTEVGDFFNRHHTVVLHAKDRLKKLVIRHGEKVDAVWLASLSNPEEPVFKSVRVS